MLFKKIVFSIILGTSLTVFGMDNQIKDCEPQIFIKKPEKFSSSKEIYFFGQALCNAFLKPDFDLVFELASEPEPIFACDYTFDDHERYLYARTMGLSMAYTDLAQKNKFNPKIAIKHDVSLLKEINKYLKEYGTFQSAIENVNIRMLWHRFLIYKMAGETYFSVGEHKNSSNYTQEQRIFPFKNAIVSYRSAMGSGGDFIKLTGLSPVLKALQETFQFLMPKVHFELLSSCCTLAQLVPFEESLKLLTEARQIQNGAQKIWDRNYKKLSKDSIEVTKKAIEYNQKQLSVSTQKSSKKVKDLRQNNLHNTQANLMEDVVNLRSQLSDNQPLKEIIQQKFILLDNFYLQSKSFDEDAHKIRDLLMEIEKIAAEKLMLKSSEGSLDLIYEHLGNLLGYDIMIKMFGKYIFAFIVTGDLEAGICRVDIIKEIEINHMGTASYINRVISAGMKNLKGDHDDWLLLEKDLEAEVNQINEEKQAREEQKQVAKQERDHGRLEALQSFLAENQKKSTESASNKANNTNNGTVTSFQTSPKPDQTTLPESATFEQNSVSEKQRKFEKQQRHEENQAKKQQEEMVPLIKDEKKKPDIDVKVHTNSKQIEFESMLASSNKSLSELYDLSSLSLKIDQEIEEGTWRFTRDEFKVYLEAMGCVYKSGHGVHTKGCLPKSIHVTLGDNLITIMNEFGGSIPLPLWDKDYVPDYLKTQILEARKKLRYLMLKALSLGQ